jgi:LemA protein
VKYNNLKKGLIMSPFLIGALIAVVFLVFMIIKTYNRLISLRQRLKNAFAQIDVQLTRRYELIPNLVETARTFMKHEQETLEKVILARNQAFQAKKSISQDPADGEAMKKLMVAESGVRSALGSFMAISESYPELRSNENMKTLMEELASSENRVAFARQAFNDATMEYNTAREVFPSNVIANTFNFTPAALFEVEDQKVRQAVKVSF